MYTTQEYLEIFTNKNVVEKRSIFLRKSNKLMNNNGLLDKSNIKTWKKPMNVS
jgi:hypothetical protein